MTSDNLRTIDAATRPTEAPGLQIEGLHKSYGKVAALDGVDLHVARGEVVALLGPNGAGKTTLVSIVAGLIRADRGAVRIGGIDICARPQAARRLVGLAPQELGVYPTLSVGQNLRFFGELAELRGLKLKSRIERLAEDFVLTDLLDRAVHTLSGGEKRRVHTAAAMLHEPVVLLLDEPTAGVDVATRSRILEVIRAVAAGGTAVCYSTHYLAEVEALGASVVMVDGGRVIAQGSVNELVRAHGVTVVEFTLSGRAAPLPKELGWRSEVDGDNGLRVFVEDPASETLDVLAYLRSAGSGVRSLEVVRPSLESVFLCLTGRRYGAGSNRSAEFDDVPA